MPVASQTLLWICLPNGLRRDGAVAAAGRLTLYLSPRLTSDGDATLGEFDFADWPATLAQAQFTLLFGATRVQATQVAQADSRLWQSLFPSDMLVRSFAPDAAGRVYASYPAARLKDHLLSVYGNTASNAASASPDALAFAQQLRTRIAQDGAHERPGSHANALLGSDRAAADEAVRSLADAARRTDGFARLAPDGGGLLGDLAQFAAFHHQARSASQLRGAVPADERLDFHQRITTLAEYPAVLRRLGLLVDVEVPPTSIPDSTLGNPGMVRGEVAFPDPWAAPTTMLTPATSYHAVRNQNFIAAPRQSTGVDSEIVAGFLNLRAPTSADASTPQFDVVQIDIEDAGHAAIQLLREEAAPAGQAPPPVRTSGLSIVRADQAQRLDEALTAGHAVMAEVAAGVDSTLAAEDLVRGYRIDIAPASTGTWRSLHARDGRYAVAGAPSSLDAADEGAVQPVITQVDTGPDAGNALDAGATNHVSESLFLWQGWSLSAPRPGNRLPDVTAPATEPARLAPAAEVGPAITAAFTATPGTLPRLRFGERYLLRARLVDLGGSGLSLDEGDAVLTNFEALGLTQNAPYLPASGDGFVFRRFEPISSPVIASRAVLQDGEAMDCIVLRSNHDVTPEDYVAQHAQYLLAPERHLLAPKSWLQMIEMFGLLDGSIGTGRDLDTSYKLAQRSDVSLPDQALLPEAVSATPYLPDPLAAGAALQGLPGAVGATLVDFGDRSVWPDLPSARLRLVEGDALPAWDAAKRELVVALPKGETRVVSLSCYPEARALDMLGMFDWMTGQLAVTLDGEGAAEPERDARHAALRALILAGQHTMITPAHPITLVHAVQQPVTAPSISSLTATRLPYSTDVFLAGAVQVHAKSTGELSLTARWTDANDDPLLQPAETIRQALPSFAVPDDLTAPLPPGAVSGTTFDAAAQSVIYADADPALLEAKLLAQVALLERTFTSLDGLVSAAPNAYGPIVANMRTAAARISAVARRRPLLIYWPEIVGLADPLASGAIEILKETLGSPTDPIIAPATTLVETAQGLQTLADDAVAELLAQHGRQPLGDTRHRRIAYQAVAKTRFAAFFPEEVTSNADDIVRLSGEMTVDIPSSAPPAPPRVSYLVPTYGWTRSELPIGNARGSHRQGGGMRLYLEGPWHSSGEGELLAILLGPGPDTPEFGSFEPFVSRCGRDPIWTSSQAPLALAATHFRSPSVAISGLRPQDAQAPENLDLVAYPVTFDADGRCYCDVSLALGTSYTTFVRLALARYQPNSIGGFELSSVARTDFIQLSPDRAVSLHAWENGYALALTGTTHSSPTRPGNPAGAELGTKVRISFWQRIPGTTDEAGWVPAGAEYVAIEDTVTPHSDGLIWNGLLTTREGRVPGGVRVRIEELETYLSLQPSEPATTYQETDRVVFMESFDI